MRRIISAMFVAALVACGGDSSTDPTSSLVGEYSLQSIDGVTVPITRDYGTTRYILNSLHLSIRPDGTFSAIENSTAGNISDGTLVTRITQTGLGTWTHVPSTGFVSLTSGGITAVTGTASGDKLTLIYPGVDDPDTYVYQR